MLTANDFESSLHLETERLCLDFTNTVNWHASEHPVEELTDYGVLLAWAQKVGLLGDPDAQRLKRLAARRPDEAQAVLERAHTLREAIYRLLVSTAEGAVVDPSDLDLINVELPTALAHARLSPAALGYTLQWPAAPDALDRMLWPVAYSAANLLTQP